MTQDQFRNKWHRQHTRYEKSAYKIFSRAFRESALKIPFNFINENNYEFIVNSAITTDDITNAYYEVYNEIGTIHGTYTGNSINNQIKIFTEGAFLSEFQRTLISWMFNNAGSRITSVRNTYAKRIIDLIAKGLLKGESIQDIVRDIEQRLEKPAFEMVQKTITNYCKN